jgi:hypothetical protein
MINELFCELNQTVVTTDSMKDRCKHCLENQQKDGKCIHLTIIEDKDEHESTIPGTEPVR